jgi:hypothetical protein
MENTTISTQDDVSSVVHQALQGPLHQVWPEALIAQRDEAKIIVKAITAEFLIMAQKPVENAHARAYVDTWQPGKPPDNFDNIEDYFILKLTELKTNMHNAYQCGQALYLINLLETPKGRVYIPGLNHLIYLVPPV